MTTYKGATGKKVIVITGAASGIGRSISLLLASRDMAIVVADKNFPQAEAVVAEIEDGGGSAAAFCCDVTVETEVDALMHFAVERFGHLDGAVNNAGISPAGMPLAELDLGRWNATIAVNLTGVFLCTKHALKALLSCGGGAIVNISSGAALRVNPNMADYNASKAGVVSVTRTAAAEYSAQGIRVNAVLPGAVETPMLMDALGGVPSLLERNNANHPIGRIGQPHEIAEAVAWLLGDGASFVTGASICVDGGYAAV